MNKWMKPAIVVCLILSALRVSMSQEEGVEEVFPRTVPRADPEGRLPPATLDSQDTFHDLLPNERTSRDRKRQPDDLLFQPDSPPRVAPDFLERPGREDEEFPSDRESPGRAVKEFDFPEDAATPEAQRLMHFRRAIRKLRSPDSTEKEREEARGLVAAGLREQFDADLSGREQKLQQLEQQLSQLKAHVERRKAARDKLVELQVQLMENEALGLAFPEAWQIHTGPADDGRDFRNVDDFPALVDPDFRKRHAIFDGDGASRSDVGTVRLPE